MDQWPKLRNVLLDICEHLYYQPPTGSKLVYPCIVCKLDDLPVIHADNNPYHLDHSYQITVIDRDPMSEIRETVALLPSCRFERFFVSDNLNHYVFRITI